jgi:hypothetical protein
MGVRAIDHPSGRARTHARRTGPARAVRPPHSTPLCLDLRRWRLRLAEKAVDGAYTRAKSRRLDRALVAFERETPRAG